MNALKYILLLLGISLSSVVVFGQNDTLFADTTVATPISFSDFPDRPELEIGTGVLTYFGDIGTLSGLSVAKPSNWGFHLNLKNPIAYAFDLNLYAMFGKISGAERYNGGLANFETTLRGGGANLMFNFKNFVSTESLIHPYIFVGISTYEFNPKGDLMDAHGRYYHYWSDGTIRTAAENSPMAGSAELMQRDYTFESDLRADENNMELYAKRAFAIPVGVGAKIKINESFNFRLGTELNFALSDNLDNINPKNQYERMGNTKNDRFLYSSFGISYSLKPTKQQHPEMIGSGDWMPVDDEDGDGVNDFADLCPFTPKDVEVDSDGCPIDSDQDGVADYLDQEPNSPAGVPVDEFGATITDEMFAQRYQAFMDTVGDLQFQKTRLATADVPSLKFSTRTKGYSVEIENADNLSADEISQLLSVPDIHVEEIDGKTYYLAGNFQTLRDAVIRKIQLENNNFQASVIRNEFGVITKMVAEAALVEAELREQANTDPSLTAAFNGESRVIFRVQIGAYRYRLSKNIFTNVPGLVVIEGNDGLTRYVSGSFENIQDAAAHKIDLLLSTLR